MNKPLNIPCTENSKNDITFNYISKITGINSRNVKRSADILQKRGIIKYHYNSGHKTCELLYIPEEKNSDNLYYNGIDYIKAFKVMNRYLSR